MIPIPAFASRRLSDPQAGGRAHEAELRCGCQIHPGSFLQMDFRTRQYALCLVLSGQGRLELDGRQHLLAPGVAFQRFPDRVHHVRMPQGCAWLFLALPAATLDLLRRLRLPNLDAPVFPAPLSPPLLRRWHSAGTHLRTCPEDRLATAATELLRLAVDVHLAARPGRTPAQERFAQRACAVLERDLARRVCLEAVARELGLSLPAFRKAFRAALGCGPQVWRVRRRLARAEELLADGSTTVEKVALELGYGDVFAFSHQFRRHTGRSPRRFQELLG